MLLPSPAELPSPELASLTELKDIRSKFYRKTRPTELGYSYTEIKAMDEISVSLLPEKKGTVFKHNEYMIESKVRFLSVPPAKYRITHLPTHTMYCHQRRGTYGQVLMGLLNSHCPEFQVSSKEEI